MIAMERTPGLDVHSPCEAELRVEQTDISFQDLSADCVRISVRIHNHGNHPSSPTIMRLESAPLGAFVPWQPLATVSVPAIEPGESRELSVDARRPHPVALGNFDRIPPSRLLTAVGSPDETNDAYRTVDELRLKLRQRQNSNPAPAGISAGVRFLAPDLWQLVGRTHPHWAGNINVFIGANPVERHMARALRVYPGRYNLAMFVVGDPRKSDAYAFDIVCVNPDWKSRLFDATNKRTLLVGSSDISIPETQWVETPGNLMVILATHPPTRCGEGNVEIHVTRRSCGKTAIVEFNLDPTAQGPGCYSM